jgi:hypothetical protein
VPDEAVETVVRPASAGGLLPVVDDVLGRLDQLRDAVDLTIA